MLHRRVLREVFVLCGALATKLVADPGFEPGSPVSKTGRLTEKRRPQFFIWRMVEESNSIPVGHRLISNQGSSPDEITILDFWWSVWESNPSRPACKAELIPR